MKATAAFLVTTFVFSLAAARGGEIALGPVTPAAAVKGQNQFCPDVAFGKDQYLVAWQRSRNQTGRIECARLDAAGKPLDAKPIVLAPDAQWQEMPRVAFGGGVWLVVWCDLRSDKEFDVFAARVTAEGKVLDPGGIPLSQTPADSSRFPAVAFDGKDFIVVWSQLAADNVGNFRLMVSRVTTDGKASAPQALEIAYARVAYTKNIEDLVEADLAVCGNRLLVAAGGFDFVQVFALADFKPVGPPRGWRPGGRGRDKMRRPVVATDGKQFLFAVWCPDPTAQMGRVSTDCQVTPSPAFWGGERKELIAPALAFDGQNYFFVRQRWSTEKRDAYGVNSHLCARQVSPDGQPIGEAEFDVAGTTADQLNTLARLASDGKGHVLMVWEQHPAADGGNIVAATRLITTR